MGYFLLTTLTLNAQITFQKTYCSSWVSLGLYIQQTNDGGYLVSTVTLTDSSENRIYLCLLKIASSGDTLWTKTLKIGGGNQSHHPLQQTNDGGYIIANSLSPSQLIKTDSNGVVLWSKMMEAGDGEFGYWVEQTSDGGYIIAGNTRDYPGAPGSFDVLLIKTDSNGNNEWSKTFGGLNYDMGFSVKQTNDGGYITVGYTLNFGMGSYDIYLIKTDAFGDTIWTKAYGGGGSETAYVIQQTSDGGYIIIGHTNSFGAGMHDVYLLKLDVSGNIDWAKTYGGASNDYGYSGEQTSDGGYIIIGETQSFGNGGDDVYLIKTDSVGDIVWTKTYGGTDDDTGESIQQTSDGGYIISGYTTSFGDCVFNTYLIKTDASGSSDCNEYQSTTSTIVTNAAFVENATATMIGSGGITTNSTVADTSILTRIMDCSDFTGLDQPLVDDNHITLYPNPTSGKLTLEILLDKPQNMQVRVLNMLGQEVYMFHSKWMIVGNYQTEISLAGFAKGIYVLQLKTDTKSTAKKIILQ